MKNFQTIISLVIISLILIPILVFAQGGQIQRRANDTVIEEVIIEDSGQPIEIAPAVQNRANIENQNQSEAQMLRVNSQEQVMIAQEEDSATGTQIQSQSQNQYQGSNASLQGEQRRSMVANAVQEMLQVAERNPEFGPQIALIAQSQNQEQAQVEVVMEKAKNRGQLRKLFFGPDYQNLNLAKDRLANHDEKINELKDLVSNITNEVDAQLLNDQIKAMEEVKTSIEKEIDSELAKPSLFGWLRRMFIK